MRPGWTVWCLRYEGLTGREREIMSLVAAGLMNKQVAARLQLSEITVKIHRGHLMKKMAADSCRSGPHCRRAWRARHECHAIWEFLLVSLALALSDGVAG
jgi:DNA-binding NarL/FixJ family response regulator